MQRTSRKQETFLMIGTKFASPTQFSYSARKRESNGTSFHPLLPISVDCGKQTLSMERNLLRVAKSAIRNFNQNAISTFPESYTASDFLSYHSRWKLIQSLRNKFWNRWSTEYLSHLQTPAKRNVQNPKLMENELVLLKNPNTKPLDWPMGRILEVFPGSDGLVRAVSVKTSIGILKRAIKKVVPLPIPDDPATAEKNI
ncbi:integrase catalytic domain-containing protein [Trichonephila clavipes]|nr:integrase catalytic domain-containing protein [Trichonephila clavipes]